MGYRVFDDVGFEESQVILPFLLAPLSLLALMSIVTVVSVVTVGVVQATSQATSQSRLK